MSDDRSEWSRGYDACDNQRKNEFILGVVAGGLIVLGLAFAFIQLQPYHFSPADDCAQIQGDYEAMYSLVGEKASNPAVWKLFDKGDEYEDWQIQYCIEHMQGGSG